MFPADQARIVPLPVERVDVAEDGLSIRFRAEGPGSLFDELRRPVRGGESVL